MLILTREFGESLMIGEDVRITILSNDRGTKQIKIGIDAPREVPVHREEVYETIQNEKSAG